ncbi:hypothetical protein IV102_33595 [bacterium]|nr:hypothetical protein [bacterium]
MPWWLGRLCILFVYSVWFCFQLSQQLDSMHFYHPPCLRYTPPSRVFQSSKNWPAYLEYGHRFDSGFRVGVKAVCTINCRLIEQFQRGEWAEWESQSRQFLKELSVSLEQLDGQQVPDLMVPPHHKISRAHGLCYESILFAREAQQVQGEARQLLLRDAEKKAKEACRLGDAGCQEFLVIWTQRSHPPPQR